MEYKFRLGTRLRKNQTYNKYLNNYFLITTLRKLICKKMIYHPYNFNCYIKLLTDNIINTKHMYSI